MLIAETGAAFTPYRPQLNSGPRNNRVGAQGIMLFSRSENSEFKQRRRKSKPIAEHSFFVPSLILWGAALAGLTVMVLPASLINQVTTIAALGALGEHARLFYAILAAGFGAGCGYIGATRWRDKLPVRSQAMMNRRADDLRPIDPAEDLGSDSLDAPLEDELELDGVEIEEDEEDVLDLTVECEAHADTADSEDNVLELGADCEADAELEAEPEPEPVSHDPLGDEHCEPAPEPGGKLPLRRRRNRGQPVELVQALGDHRARHAAMHKDRRDLGNFTRMAAENPAANSTGGSGEFHHTPAAIDKLRSVPPQDLSLVQMVERLAMALNERQESARTRPP